MQFQNYSDMEDKFEEVYARVGLLKVRFFMFSPIINTGYFALLMVVYFYGAYMVYAEYGDYRNYLFLIVPFAYISLWIFNWSIKHDKKYSVKYNNTLLDVDFLNLRKKLFAEISKMENIHFTTDFALKYKSINNIKYERNFLEILGQNKYRALVYSGVLYCGKRIIDTYDKDMLYYVIVILLLAWFIIPILPVLHIREKRHNLTKMLFLNYYLAETDQDIVEI